MRLLPLPFFPLLALAGLCATGAGVSAATLNLAGTIDRPLRYRPEGTDFVIENGAEFFNRPLYGANTAFRIDGGDKPEFSLYLSGHRGNLRLGIRTAAGAKWLNDASRVVTRYRPGSLLYEVTDPLLSGRTLRVAVLAWPTGQGLIMRAELSNPGPIVELIWAYGGADGKRGQRNGDIGTEVEPVGQFFQLRPEDCRRNVFSVSGTTFTMDGPTGFGSIWGAASANALLATGDSRQWASAPELLASLGSAGDMPVLVGLIPLTPVAGSSFLALGHGDPILDGLRVLPGEIPPLDPPSLTVDNLPRIFASAEARRRKIAEKIIVDTPDPYINAAASALCVAADGVWDEASGTVQHGAVAWRNKLLGWRGPYANDDLGWHDRADRHFTYWAGRQNTGPIPAAIAPPDAATNLSRDEAALHTNGDISNSHYDMNLVYIDEVFRHLAWTGDLDFARRLWPVIVRHLAWEQRLFRRPFGPDGLPLYEGYCCIWASDDLEYEGGGATHASAYNYYENIMAARLARRLGHDPAPYDREANLIWQGMHRELWLPDRGWFGEWKDLLGRQTVHASPALWTFYHTVDSGAATPREAWQMTRFIDTQIAHIPVRGPGLPADGAYVLPTTNWMPYTWSTNNVVMAEVAHTALGYWQAGRPDEAYRLFQGAVLASMYVGLCPGNAGMTNTYDMARGESQRDFADAIGTSSRALIEGLFGVTPDVPAGELRVRPGFPAAWDHASLRHPDFNFDFHRSGSTDRYEIEPKFPHPMALRLQLVARTDQLDAVTVNGAPASWRPLDDAAGSAQVEIAVPAAPRFAIVLTWGGAPLSAPGVSPVAALGHEFHARFGAAHLLAVDDPQGALRDCRPSPDAFSATAAGTAGFRTVFAHLQQGEMRWWAPVEFETRPGDSTAVSGKPPADPRPRYEPVNLTAYFNDRITNLYRNEYLSPRSPDCSLAMPRQGIGTWCRYQASAMIDDTGLRAASRNGLFTLPGGLSFSTPGPGTANNVVFTSQWDNYPRDRTVPLRGRAGHLYLLMAGSTNSMQSRCDNGEVIVTYRDGTTERLALENPTNWWPIEEDYWLDDFAFRRPGPIPPRIDLRTGAVRVLDPRTFAGQGGPVAGGAAVVLDLPLQPGKELRSLTVRALANEVVVGLLAATLAR